VQSLILHVARALKECLLCHTHQNGLHIYKFCHGLEDKSNDGGKTTELGQQVSDGVGVPAVHTSVVCHEKEGAKQNLPELWLECSAVVPRDWVIHLRGRANPNWIHLDLQKFPDPWFLVNLVPKIIGCDLVMQQEIIVVSVLSLLQLELGVEGVSRDQWCLSVIFRVTHLSCLGKNINVEHHKIKHILTLLTGLTS
jgi:hypothetical protein